ncbi:uncharacterized protein [Amphiura filiformis]|uniref:uncharacterized protein n=1 Tax=Amphiura filiformis TaxID=82378 RepID=UPI003B227A4B
MEFVKQLLCFSLVLLMSFGHVTLQTTDTATDMEELLATDEVTTADTATDLLATASMVTAYSATVTVKASLGLNEVFTSDLNDPTTSAYQTLETDFISTMDDVFQTAYGATYNKTVVEGFRAGSVYVDFRVVFNEAPVASDDYVEATTTALTDTLTAAISDGFGDFTVIAGSLVAATDLSVSSFSFAEAAADIDFDLNVDNIYTVSITLANGGGASLKSIAADGDSGNNNADNFAITFIVSDSNDLSDSTALTIESDADVSEATNMQAGIAISSTLVLQDVYALVNVPKADCGLYKHLCVKVEGSTDSVFIDEDSTNDYKCIAAFANNDAEYLPCSGCMTRVSFIVLLLVPLVSYYLTL